MAEGSIFDDVSRISFFQAFALSLFALGKPNERGRVFSVRVLIVRSRNFRWRLVRIGTFQGSCISPKPAWIPLTGNVTAKEVLVFLYLQVEGLEETLRPSADQIASPLEM